MAAFFAPTAAASAFRSICPLTGTTPTTRAVPVSAINVLNT